MTTPDTPATSGGSLTCVGLGMLLGAHISPRARSHIESADIVFAAVSDPIVELWLRAIRPDFTSLQPFYAEGKPRQQTYAEMVDAMLEAARSGRQVCGVFYGHPGVFAQAPHEAVAMARMEGIAAVMEPGISAEDCLFADLGIDPGRVGCLHFETTQFMIFRRSIDASAYLILWQIGLAGERSFRRFETGAAQLEILLQRLAEDYPLDHEVIAYEAATLPIQAPRVERFQLKDLPSVAFTMHSTLVIPPAKPLRPDLVMRHLLKCVEASEAHRSPPEPSEGTR